MLRYVNFFSGYESDLQRAYEEGDPDRISRLLYSVKPSLYNFIVSVINGADSEADDFIQEILLESLTYVNNYRYLCPLCDGNYRHIEHFKHHALRKHGCILEPRVTIWHNVSYLMRLMILNYRTIFYRHNKHFVSCGYGNLDFDNIAGNGWRTPERIVIFNELVENLRTKCEKEQNEALRYFISRTLDLVEPTSIFDEMIELKLAKTRNSAWNSVKYHIRKKKYLEEYQGLLFSGIRAYRVRNTN